MQLPLFYREAGNVGGPLLFFIHGWPDSAELWEKQFSYFSPTHHCVAVTLPSFGDKPEAALDFPDLVERLVTTICVCKKTSTPSVTVVGHDWGAFLTYLLDQRHPEIASRLITLDVGAHFEPRSFAHGLFMIAYQWWLVAAYGVGKVLPPLGNAMTRWFSLLVRAPRGANVRCRFNYPYFYFWRARLLARYRDALPIGYRPNKPLLYLYGTKKRYHFHSEKWLQRVRSMPGSAVVEIKAGHWLQLTNAAATNAAIEGWLKA